MLWDFVNGCDFRAGVLSYASFNELRCVLAFFKKSAFLHFGLCPPGDIHLHFLLSEYWLPILGLNSKLSLCPQDKCGLD